MSSPGDTLAAEELSVGRMTGGWLGGWRVGLETASHRHNLGREGDGPTLFSSRCRPPASYSVGLAFNRFAYPTTKKHCNNRKSCPFTSNFRSSCHHLSYFCPTPPSSSSSEGVIHEQHLKNKLLERRVTETREDKGSSQNKLVFLRKIS